MELDRLLEMLATRNSPQAHLVSDEPLRIWSGGGWQSANTPLAAGRLNRMLVLAAPPEVRAVVHDLNAKYEFDVTGSSGLYRVHVDVVAGRRSVFVTRLDSHGVPVRSLDDGTGDFDLPSTGESASSDSPPQSPTSTQLPEVEVEPESEPDQWYYSHADQSMGPYPFEQMTSLVKSGALLPETMVLNARVGYWREVKMTELGRFLPRNNAGEWSPSADWQPPSQADITKEKIFMRSLVGAGIGVGVLLLGWIVLSQMRGANRNRDYSAQAVSAIEDLSRNTSSGALHNVQVQHDGEEPDRYFGKAQYENDFLADVSVEATERDFWEQPQEWELKVEAHDYASDLESLVRTEENRKYAANRESFRLSKVSLYQDSSSIYKGVFYWDNNTEAPVKVSIKEFNDNGEISTWDVNIESN